MQLCTNKSLFISNAGDGAIGRILKREAEEFERATKLNLANPVKLRHHFLYKMHQRKRGGAVLFVSSAIAASGAPFIADYSATKARKLHHGDEKIRLSLSINKSLGSVMVFLTPLHRPIRLANSNTLLN